MYPHRTTPDMLLHSTIIRTLGHSGPGAWWPPPHLSTPHSPVRQAVFTDSIFQRRQLSVRDDMGHSTRKHQTWNCYLGLLTSSSGLISLGKEKAQYLYQLGREHKFTGRPHAPYPITWHPPENQPQSQTAKQHSRMSLWGRGGEGGEGHAHTAVYSLRVYINNHS